MIITSSGFSTFPPIVLASQDSLNGCGTGFACLSLGGCGPNTPVIWCFLVLSPNLPVQLQKGLLGPGIAKLGKEA